LRKYVIILINGRTFRSLYLNNCIWAGQWASLANKIYACIQ
jgi:hypothetical protein